MKQDDISLQINRSKFCHRLGVMRFACNVLLVTYGLFYALINIDHFPGLWENFNFHAWHIKIIKTKGKSLQMALSAYKWLFNSDHELYSGLILYFGFSSIEKSWEHQESMIEQKKKNHFLLCGILIYFS